MRQRLPATREGKTVKIKLADQVTLYVTINTDGAGRPREMFIKANKGWQGWCDVIAETASLYLQCDGSEWSTLMCHWRGHRFDPQAIGKGASIPDAIARAMEDQEQTEIEKGGA